LFVWIFKKRKTSKNEKQNKTKILSSQVMQKQVKVQIWSAGGTLPTHDSGKKLWTLHIVRFKRIPERIRRDPALK